MKYDSIVLLPLLVHILHGEINVLRERYDFAEDDYVLIGSCGLEYKIISIRPSKISKYPHPLPSASASFQTHSAPHSSSFPPDPVRIRRVWRLSASTRGCEYDFARSNFNQSQL